MLKYMKKFILNTFIEVTEVYHKGTFYNPYKWLLFTVCYFYKKFNHLNPRKSWVIISLPQTMR